jgi:hypothetical protein
MCRGRRKGKKRLTSPVRVVENLRLGSLGEVHVGSVVATAGLASLCRVEECQSKEAEGNGGKKGRTVVANRRAAAEGKRLSSVGELVSSPALSTRLETADGVAGGLDGGEAMEEEERGGSVLRAKRQLRGGRSSVE